MKPDYEQLRQQALSLDVKTRADLARDLLESLDALSETAIEQLWLEEAARRQEAVKRDPSRLVDGEEVFAKARAMLR